jgi:hypothetical protein
VSFDVIYICRLIICAPRHRSSTLFPSSNDHPSMTCPYPRIRTSNIRLRPQGQYTTSQSRFSKSVGRTGYSTSESNVKVFSVSKGITTGVSHGPGLRSSKTVVIIFVLPLRERWPVGGNHGRTWVKHITISLFSEAVAKH